MEMERNDRERQGPGGQGARCQGLGAVEEEERGEDGPEHPVNSRSSINSGVLTLVISL